MPDSTNTQGKRRPLVMGNWKMNGRQANNEALLSALKPAVAGFDTIDVAVCPPFPYLSQTASQLADSNIRISRPSRTVPTPAKSPRACWWI